MKDYKKVDFGFLDKLIMFLIFPLIGAIIGYFLPIISKKIASLEWFFFQGPFKLIASFEGPYLIYATIIIGIVCSIAIIVIFHYESLIVYLRKDKIAFEIRERKTYFNKEDIKSIFIDQKDIVLLSNGNNEIFRYKFSMPTKTLIKELELHGYKVDKPQLIDQFVIWSPDRSDLGKDANALFKAREDALRKGREEDSDELLEELWKLKISVKTIKKRQYYRM